MRFDVQAAVHVLTENGYQRLVTAAGGVRLNGHSNVEPDTVGNAIAIVVDIPDHPR